MCNKQMRISNTVGLKLNMIKYVREWGVIVQPKDTWFTLDWKKTTRGRTKKKVREEYKLFLYTFCKMALEEEVKNCITDHQTQQNLLQKCPFLMWEGTLLHRVLLIFLEQLLGTVHLYKHRGTKHDYLN